MENKEIEKLANKISELCNNFNDDNTRKFVEYLTKEHRTLQQSFTRLCREWFLYLASLEGGQYDLRNEASVKLAKEIKEVLSENPLPLI